MTTDRDFKHSRYLRRPQKPRQTDPQKVRAYLNMLERTTGRSVNDTIDWNGQTSRHQVGQTMDKTKDSDGLPRALPVSPVSAAAGIPSGRSAAAAPGAAREGDLGIDGNGKRGRSR